MNIRIALPIALLMGFAFLPTSCSKAKEAAGVDITLENAPVKAAEALKGVTEGLGKITDLESAKSAVTSLASPMAMLASAKKLLGDKMPDLGSLGGIVGTLKEKFAGKTEILGVLQPILDKIMAMVGK